VHGAVGNIQAAIRLDQTSSNERHDHWAQQFHSDPNESETARMTRPVLIPHHQTHPITIEPTGRQVVVRVGGAIVPDSTSALTLAHANNLPVQHVPLVDVERRPTGLFSRDAHVEMPALPPISRWHVRRRNQRNGHTAIEIEDAAGDLVGLVTSSTLSLVPETVEASP
jgi:hypothetical protein